MKTKGEPEKILLLIPTLLGIAMLIAGSASGVTGLFYAGVAVIFGGNGLLVLVTIIYVIYTIASVAKEEAAKEKRKAESGGSTQSQGCFGKGCLPAAIVIGMFLGFPFVGMVFMNMENFSVGVPLFFLGPAILAVFAVRSSIKDRKKKREYDAGLYREDVKKEQIGTVELCIKLDIPVNDNNYFVRVNSDGEHISAYSRSAVEKGTTVKIVTYDNDKVEAVEIGGGYLGGEHKHAESTEEKEPHERITPDGDGNGARTAKNGTRGKAKAKASNSGVSAPAPAVLPLTESEAPHSEDNTESVTVGEQTQPINENPPAAESTGENDAHSPQPHTVRARPTVGYRKIEKK